MTYKFLLVLLPFFILIHACSDKPQTLINTAHLNRLYEEISFKGRPSAIVHIYADYPEYEWTDAAGEGVSCVDDVARAAVFYLRHHQNFQDQPSLNKTKRLLNFLLGMQAENGYFYNFIDENMMINSVRENSLPVGQWWSWRALWALGEAYPFYHRSDPSFAGQLDKSIQRLLAATKPIVRSYPQTEMIDGMKFPTYLPQKMAADQTAELLSGLIPYFQATQDSLAGRLIRVFCDGMMMMQGGDSTEFPFGAFLGWVNEWHFYGNSQADVLFQAGALLKEPRYYQAALREVDSFYPYLMKQNYLRSFRLKYEQGKIFAVEMKHFEQIAYGIRPMVMACLQAYQATGNQEYAQRAGEIACWLFGKNIVGKSLYDPATGRCFDGVDNEEKINFNSGAESTIEALLALLAVEQNMISRQFVHDYYRKVSH